MEHTVAKNSNDSCMSEVATKRKKVVGKYNLLLNREILAHMNPAFCYSNENLTMEVNILSIYINKGNITFQNCKCK